MKKLAVISVVPLVIRCAAVWFFSGLGLATLFGATFHFSLVDDWSDTNNPNGAWSLNSSSTVMSNWHSVSGGTCWDTDGSTNPSWAKSTADEDFHSWLDRETGDVIAQAWWFGPARTNVTWTSPKSGTITVTGRTWDAIGSSFDGPRDGDWALAVNGITIAQRASIYGLTRNEYGAAFADNLLPEKTLDGISVAAGDVVMFSTGGRSTSGVQMEITLAPVITVLDPNGGEMLPSGSDYTIKWESSGLCSSNVKIEYSDSNGLGWQVIDPNTANNGQYNWAVPTITSNQCLVRISDANDVNGFDTSDRVFIIYECQLSSPADLNKDCKVDLMDFAILAQDWLRNGNPFDENYTEFLPIMWVSINDSGVSGHEGFHGQMSKYETTNAQFCRYLNAAKASGDVTISGSNVIGANGSGSGSDFAGQVYYDLAGAGFTYDEATDGGASRINYTGSSFTVDSGFENHPVTYVSWYGATAFCNYYGFRLPTEWEWQAVADYDGSFIYGCGTTITNGMANYLGSVHPYGLTTVGAFGSYGYGMCDMAGNVWEWTSSCYYSDCSGDDLVIRGGGWSHGDNYCPVSDRYNFKPDGLTGGNLGFRVCR